MSSLRRILVLIVLISMLVPAMPVAAASRPTLGSTIKNVIKKVVRVVTPKKKKKSMPKFSSAKEFDAYVAKLRTAQKARNKNSGSVYKGTSFGAMGQLSMLSESTAMSTAPSAQSEPSITNNQELGVDEGDIVKTYKDFFVVLRRGRLFTIRVTDQGKPVLTPITKINAYPDGLKGSGWYDEMLISGNKIVVVGYNYSHSATEIGLFAINDAGALTHTATYFLDSNDYYSSRNYASRLVDGKLIFYMPYSVFNYGWQSDDKRPDVKLPAMRKWIGGDTITDDISILKKTDIYKPIQEDIAPALHTVVTCDLNNDLDCSAKSVLGPRSRNFYVSPNAVYLWMTEATPWHPTPLKDNVSKCLDDLGVAQCVLMPHKPTAYVYRMDLHDGSTTVLRADGGPIDQFSFKEEHGSLNVLVHAEGLGEAMWRSEKTSGELALMRVPLSAFTDKPTLVAKDAFTALPAPDGYGFQNRFVGDYVLYGTGGAWANDGLQHKLLYAKKFTTKDPVQVLALAHSVDRIEVMGDAAAVIGTAEKALKFSAMTLGATPTVADTYALENTTQGELRSHGFFYAPQRDGTGILGLPIRKENDDTRMSYFRDSAAIIFLNVSTDKKFTSLGTLDSKIVSNRDADDQCVASCVDWYGNARPIFSKGRVFALMGYELVEGGVRENTIKELTRTDYLRNLR